MKLAQNSLMLPLLTKCLRDCAGDKSRAKAMMSAAQVPVVPGYHGQQQDASW